MNHIVKNFIKFSVYIFLFSLFFLHCGTTDESDRLHICNGQTMGTFFSVKIVKQENFEENDYVKIDQEIDKRLRYVNQLMSTYIDSSEISRFNQYADTNWFAVSPEVARVVHYALEVSRISEGAFDITVGPLVNLWGFGPEKRPSLIPDEKEIKERKSKVGYEKLAVRISPAALQKKIPDLYCDLSAIAKGYGVDVIADFLDSMQVKSYLIEIGGEIRTRGRNHLGKLWRIGISTPSEKMGIQKVIQLNNEAVATSGDYLNYFEVNGVRYSHTIDPRTGRPITHKLASVTVVHQSCMMADALATAIDVMGPEKGLEFAKKQKLPVFLIVKGENGFIEKMTPEFKKILELN